MAPRFFLSIFLSCLPFWAAAEVPRLPISADYCAIKFAMTGRADAECPAVMPNGAIRSVDGTIAAPTGGRGYYIHFAFASAELSPDYQAHLARLSNVLRSSEMAGVCIKLVGHTDTVGGNAYNQSLSERRARSVERFLVGQLAINGQRILTEGKGEMQPLTGISGTNAQNRRVEILARQGATGACIS